MQQKRKQPKLRQKASLSLNQRQSLKLSPKAKAAKSVKYEEMPCFARLSSIFFFPSRTLSLTFTHFLHFCASRMQSMHLKDKPVSELEELYLQVDTTDEPIFGTYKGHYLKTLANAGATNPLFIMPEKFFFSVLPFGLNFYGNSGDWYFFHPNFKGGKFQIKAEDSRWRPTTSLRLTYSDSKLPFKGILYDEIKRIPDDNGFIGLGGLNYDQNWGDHFFFYLEPVSLDRF